MVCHMRNWQMLSTLVSLLSVAQAKQSVFGCSAMSQDESIHIPCRTAFALAHLSAVTSQIDQQSRDNPEPVQTGHTASKGRDDGIRQCCKGQKEYAQQRHNPASVKGAIDERCREPDHRQRDA